MKPLIAILLISLLQSGCGLALQTANHAVYPSQDYHSPEYQHARENDHRIREAEREYFRNRPDPDAPTYVTPGQ